MCIFEYCVDVGAAFYSQAEVPVDDNFVKCILSQAEEIAIESGAEDLFFCESENGTKNIKVWREKNFIAPVFVNCYFKLYCNIQEMGNAWQHVDAT